MSEMQGSEYLTNSRFAETWRYSILATPVSSPRVFRSTPEVPCASRIDSEDQHDHFRCKESRVLDIDDGED